MPTEPSQFESLFADAPKAVLASACKNAGLLFLPHKAPVYGSSSLPNAHDYNGLSALPAESGQLAIVRTGGLSNLALRGWITSNGSGLTPGLETVTARLFGLRPRARWPEVANPKDNFSYGFSGQYLGEATFGLNTVQALASDAELKLLSAGVLDSSWADTVTISGAAPYSGFNTTLGANGAGRWLRLLDLLGFPLVACAWSGSDTYVGFNAEWYTY